MVSLMILLLELVHGVGFGAGGIRLTGGEGAGGVSLVQLWLLSVRVEATTPSRGHHRPTNPMTHSRVGEAAE